ncbi:MAG: response regulator [Pseudomonadota bacterium]
MIRVLTVDDHQLVRNGISSVINATDEFEMVGEASSGEEAITQCATLHLDVVLMDINMAGIGGIEATHTIRRRFTHINVVMVTALNGDLFSDQAHEAGAVGFVSKGCAAGELEKAVRAAAQGKPYISIKVAQRMAAERYLRGSEHDPVFDLSARETQVLLLITNGTSTQEMVDSLHLSPKTISSYRRRLHDKLGVDNDVQLTHYALRHGLLEAC